jgi:hypothetical protein
MVTKKELMPPCGLYCGVCGILIADRDNNQKFKERLTTVYNLPAEDIQCQGCRSDKVFTYCRACLIKDCTTQKGYEGCHQCKDFPCEHIDNFPLPVGKKVILRVVPRWREIGTEKVIAEEKKRYVCPSYGYKLFRGAKTCRNCKKPVDAD